PYIVARMTEVLLAGRHPRKVLEVGTGSAYQTAVLATLVNHVHSVERIGKLLERARERLRSLALRNVRLKHGDGGLGWVEHAPYDAIVVTAAAREIPPPLLEQLVIGGCLVAPVGPPEVQQLVFVERRIAGVERRVVCPVNFVPLSGGVL
ncbi:MAG: methyltransferase domain-containing protein, partial [Pseudomonadota bacterium]|nr:methyltransferase domain-containing protein [Pseudomonadota bacterium]